MTRHSILLRHVSYDAAAGAILFFESAASAGGLLLGPAREKYLGASTDVFLGVRRRHAPKAFKKETGV